MEGISGAAGGVDARGEAGVAARHVGVVGGRVVAEGVGGAPADGDVGRSLHSAKRRFEGGGAGDSDTSVPTESWLSKLGPRLRELAPTSRGEPGGEITQPKTQYAMP